MRRKVFLSFLGTNDYKRCTYNSLEKGSTKVVEFVQTAVLDLYCTDYKEGDITFIFLTKLAKEKNWQKLLGEIGERKYFIKPISELSEGFSESDIWEIFETVFQQLKENDEIVLDVTHGFRSLPMLGLVLLNYAKTLKNITVRAITYGAFEALGPAFNIETRIPEPSKRKAPLLDLTAFSSIQQWSFGVESFVKTGNSELISSLASENIRPILINSHGRDFIASSIRNLIKSLKEIDSQITTNRGKKIDKGQSIEKAFTELGTLSGKNSQIFAPLRPVLEIIGKKLKIFTMRDSWVASVEWCVDHGFVQQGITQLQEGIISYVATRNDLDKSNLEHRELVAQALNILAQKIKEED